MTTYRFEVEYASHDSLHEGKTSLSLHRVVVVEDSWVAASLVALQIVSCVGAVRNGVRSGMPTRLYTLE